MKSFLQLRKIVQGLLAFSVAPNTHQQKSQLRGLEHILKSSSPFISVSTAEVRGVDSSLLSRENEWQDLFSSFVCSPSILPCFFLTDTLYLRLLILRNYHNTLVFSFAFKSHLSSSLA